MRNQPLLPGSALALLVVPSCGPSVPEVGRLDPTAPPETAQFAFLLGEWDCVIRTLAPDGSGHVERRATWTGRLILGGWAIQDDRASRGYGGRVLRGTNIRVFDPGKGRWDVRCLSTGSPQWKTYEATQEGNPMVVVGGAGLDARGEYVDRNVFHDIGDDRFRWRKDRSWDRGETWVEGVATIEATRRGPPR